MEIKIFTKDMLSVLWGKIKTLGSTSIAALSEVYSPLGHKHTTAEITDLTEATQGKSGLMSAADKTKIDGIAEKAQVNVVEGIKVNGNKLTPDTLKDVDIPVPTKTSDIVNDSNFAVDADYVHTDNNYTSAEKSKLEGVAAGVEVCQRGIARVVAAEVIIDAGVVALADDGHVDVGVGEAGVVDQLHSDQTGHELLTRHQRHRRD